MPSILKVMMDDQREHTYASFGETYLKVYNSNKANRIEPYL